MLTFEHTCWPNIEGGVVSRYILQIVRISSNGLGSNFSRGAGFLVQDPWAELTPGRVGGRLVGGRGDRRIASLKFKQGDQQGGAVVTQTLIFNRQNEQSPCPPC